MKLLRKYEALQKAVSRHPGAVAFSGGADSSLLLKAVVAVFGEGAPAFFADSVLQTDADRDNAIRTALHLGANLRVVALEPLQWPEFAANPPDRCYICKKKVYLLFTALLPEKGMVLYDGSNLDDLDRVRPGRRAIAELGVKTPLVEAGLCKDEIRQLGKYLKVPTWNRDSASCLATRIPAGTEICDGNLGLVAACEEIIAASGFSGCRVKLCNDEPHSVRLELKKEDITAASRRKIREKLISELKKTGVEQVWLSLRGR